MTPAQAVKAIMARQGITNAALADKVGATNAAMWDRLKRENMSVKVLEEMLRMMDYEIILQPKALGRRPDGCYVLDMKGGDSR